MRRVLSRFWIPLLIAVVLTVSGLVVSKLRKIFGSQDLNAEAAGAAIAEIDPKVVEYAVSGSAGSTAKIVYFDADANTHEVNVPLPWSVTITRTAPKESLRRPIAW